MFLNIFSVAFVLKAIALFLSNIFSKIKREIKMATKLVNRKTVETIPVTTAPTVVNRVQIGVKSDAQVRDSEFEAFMSELSKKDVRSVFPSIVDYHAFRLKTGIDSDGMNHGFLGTKGVLDSVMLEYNDGSWDGIRVVLSYLWTKYLGDKFGNQMMANFVFGILVQGVESGWAAVTKVIREKLGDDAVKDTESIVDGINHIVIGGGAEELKNRINDVRTDINKPSTDGAKPSILQKILRGLRWVFSGLFPNK